MLETTKLNQTPTEGSRSWADQVTLQVPQELQMDEVVLVVLGTSYEDKLLVDMADLSRVIQGGPWFISSYFFTIDNDTYCTVFKLCNGKDLQFTLKIVRTFAENEARVLISQILHGLAYLDGREERIIHYDLKLANILLVDGVVKISDFGLCKVMEVGSESLELTSPGAGTIWYVPPECLVGGANSQISTKVDVWSAGVVFYELLFGRVPFGFGAGKSRDIIRKEIIDNALHFPTTPEISLEVKPSSSAPMNGFAQQAESMSEGMAKTVMSRFEPGRVLIYTELANEFAVFDRCSR
ncbi:hypothetical protein SLEP1_g45409 [Rubroshorea leprosula]|uniref:Protein kinase domain-containing protein n=1 Tax=Rubroshorea leprosula TaxID=152421 RepID=A0AAV5LKL4_9ROSI|nr:hypothetical protein SLEP1_g45409 [Rubroshorea leprosula]